MKILAVALFVVAMAALTTADDGDSMEDPAPEDRVPEMNETTQTDGFPQSDVSVENPAPEDRVPETTLNKTTQTRGFLRFAGKVRQKRQTQISTNLKWVTWRGRVPDGAVYIYNRHVERTDYVCKSGCDSGFYSRSKGSYCYYPWGEREHKASQFEILVNEGNLENLVWKDESWGDVPKNSVKTCSWSDTYVGKNKYGLGKVSVKNNAFFLPWKGDEEWYKWYDVLTYDTAISSQRITNVRYNTKQAKIVNYPPETMSRSSTSNNQCRTVTKTVQLQKTVQVENRWDTSSSTTLGVTTTMTAGVPDVASTSVQISAETTFTLSRGTTKTKSKSHSFSVEVTVPPNHLCVVRMLGNKSSADIPFTAHVTRKYRSGKTTSGSISGIFKGVDTYEVHTVADRCTPIPNARPCPE